MTPDVTPMSLDDAQRLFERPAYVSSAPPSGPGSSSTASVTAGAENAAVQSAKNEAQRARAQAVYDTALSVGIKTGLAFQLHNVEDAVHVEARDLDLVYNFTGLMIRQRVVPPVITEARNLYNQDGDYAVRLSGAYYRIERQARFASVAPNWREYLTFPRMSVEKSSLLTLLAPKTEEEREVWRQAVKSGWDQGVEQANLMLTQAMDRLNRDFNGMSRFHSFVVAGKVSMPVIAGEDIPITKTGGSMAVDETLLRLTALPDFNSHPDTWQGLVTSSAPAKTSIDSHAVLQKGP
jgi:defect-in-organelle-trafficking protein DotC